MNENNIKKPDFSWDNFFREQERRAERFKGIDYEYQEIGFELQKWFNKNIWWIFYKPYAELEAVKEALDICKKSGKKELPYFIGILKRKYEN